MKKLLCALCAFVLMSTAAWAAGSCNSQKISLGNGYSVYKFEWTASDGGVVSYVGSISVDGTILGVKFHSNPSNIPTTAYDVTLLTDGGQDVLMVNGVTGLGANIASAITDIATQFKKPTTSSGTAVNLFNENLTPGITNAGNATQGVIYLHVWGK